jgi:NAD(P)-dependent dehydrogenase (short-subunit alcohol dehydrogenase family)
MINTRYENMFDLEGKTAIVTGAGSGIGRAVARLYAANKVKVVSADLDESGGKETVNIIKKDGGEAAFVRADSSSPEQNEALVEETLKRYGALHIACNNAGIGGPLAPTGEYPIDGWNKVIAVNLSGVFYGMRYQIPAIIKSGGGAIVNMASILGSVGTKLSPAYVASKHGIVGLTKTAALENADKNLRINVVGPGYIDTPLLSKNLPPETLKALELMHPLGRLGKPEEVAELVLWLSSPKASFVTGSYFAIDGGYLAQ